MENMSIRSKAFRYKRCIQWAILGVISIVCIWVYVAMNGVAFRRKDNTIPPPEVVNFNTYYNSEQEIEHVNAPKSNKGTERDDVDREYNNIDKSDHDGHPIENFSQYDEKQKPDYSVDANAQKSNKDTERDDVDTKYKVDKNPYQDKGSAQYDEKQKPDYNNKKESVDVNAQKSNKDTERDDVDTKYKVDNSADDGSASAHYDEKQKPDYNNKKESVDVNAQKSNKDTERDDVDTKYKVDKGGDIGSARHQDEGSTQYDVDTKYKVDKSADDGSASAHYDEKQKPAYNNKKESVDVSAQKSNKDLERDDVDTKYKVDESTPDQIERLAQYDVKRTHELPVEKKQNISEKSPIKQADGNYSGKYKYLFHDPSKSVEERVDDIVKRLTIKQAVEQSQAIYGQPTPGIPNLGIKPYMWITECLHGLHGTNGTSYPQAIGLAATFSPELVHNVSVTISYEARAFWNSNVRNGVYETMQGLTCFSPTINIFRHPMWGRNQETYGEDPYLTGVMAAAFVKGLQGTDNGTLRVGATCKHFAAHSGPENNPISRYKFDAVVKESDLRMTFLPAFKACVDAGAVGIMCSYNRINGVPACANKELLNGTLRHLWKFDGYVVSDANAVDNIHTKHYYHETKTEVVAEALTAGVNLELAISKYAIYQKQVAALDKKLLTEEQIRNNIKPLFRTRVRLGEFDPFEMNKYNKVPMSFVQRTRHRDLATKTAASSFILLKNVNHVLPLRDNVKTEKLVVLGPVADSLESMNGGYGPQINSLYAQTPLKGFQRLSSNVQYEKACENQKSGKCDEKAVKEAVKGAHLVIVTLNGDAESEFVDRSAFSASGSYVQLVQKIPQWTNATIILVLFAGAPVDIKWAKESKNIAAILLCFLPGQSAGDAIYDSLKATKPEAVPAARLPFTWPQTLENIPPITNYRMEGRTYRYSKEEPLYPFGYGLSYTHFKYLKLQVTPQTVSPQGSFKVEVTLQNIGNFDADEVIQVYISWPNAKMPSLPQLQLLAFKRVRIAKSEVLTVDFQIQVHQLMVWVDHEVGFKAIPGRMRLFAGGQQPNQKTVVKSNVLVSEFTVL